MKSNRIFLPVLAAVWFVLAASAAPTDPLEAGFLNPPDSAKPQTWWHWMNGNITTNGITADLEAMKQIGLGGATIVNVDSGIPRGPVNFMSPQWRKDFKFAIQEANRLGLEMCVENCAGWSSSGGPWNTVTNAMQRVTTSEVRVTGPTNFSVSLPQPPTTLGFYRDIAVLGFPSLDAGAKIANLDAKDGRNGNAVLSSPTAGDSTAGAVQRRQIVDLTSKLTADGKLNWRVPAGEWVILRLGYTPTGVKNHPAPIEGTGLECDKFSKAALDAHWAGFMQKVLDDIGPLAGRTLDSSFIDSYEVGGQNWTADFRAEFQKRRGYDPLKFLPAFTGRVVDNPAVSERFLWDVRRTIADLFAENYYGHFAELCHQHGLMSMVEPYTGPFESLQSGASEDPVMGEFWTGSQGDQSVKLAASVAHIYGKTIVGAESFTASPQNGRWQNDPYSLKTLGDLMYCWGLNRYTFHRYAMQPWTNRWPGMTMGQWGFHFERTETWWDEGKPWIDYITHSQFLLQQGRAVADAAYFTGESAPVETRDGNPALPAGYDFDDVNADVLLHGATVKNGRLTLASGANYAVLILPPNDVNMTPQTLKCIAKLVRAGATVVGPRPQHSPSLADYPKCDAQVEKLAAEIWGKCDGSHVLENSYGKGRVVWNKSLADVFAAQSLKPDFEFQGDSDATHLAYAHRVAGKADIYFVSNQRRQFDSAGCTFRVSGKTPELWHPDTGMIEQAPIWSAQDGRVKVRLNLDPAGSVFVIFRKPFMDWYLGMPVFSPDRVISVQSTIAAASSAAPKLEIQRAIYAAAGDTNGMDVTAKLSKLVRDGQLVVDVKNDSFGGDPAVNRVKELRVGYTLDGQPGHTIVPENETLTLPATTGGRAPQWETIVAQDGSPMMKAWSNGRVELRTSNGKVLHAVASNVPAPQEVTGAWDLSFPPNWGAPPSVALDKLISWTDSTNDGVRYFSGTATYEKEIEIPADRLAAGRELWLDLGAVKNFAGVSLNGQDFGVLWKPPFRVNITTAAKPGLNKLSVKVTNLWPNRLIGDEQLPPDVEWNGKQLAAWPQWLLDGKPSPTGAADVHHMASLDEGFAAAGVRPARSGDAADGGNNYRELINARRGAAKTSATASHRHCFAARLSGISFTFDASCPWAFPQGPAGQVSRRIRNPAGGVCGHFVGLCVASHLDSGGLEHFGGIVGLAFNVVPCNNSEHHQSHKHQTD